MHPRPVCVKCQLAMRPEKNGIYVISMFMDPPQPYQIWAADLWKCPKCGCEIVKGFCAYPYEHFEEGFDKILKIAEASQHIYEYEG